MRIYKIEEHCPYCNKLLNKKHICLKCKKRIPYHLAVIVEIDEQDNEELTGYNKLGELI